MEFTKREIALAFDMKDLGLGWKPVVGDWYCLHNSTLQETWCISSGCQDEQFVKCRAWLPLWHQCRKILDDNNIVIQLFDLQHHTDDNIEIICYRVLKDGGQWRYALGSIKARTDLEALYQAILLFVLPEKD